MSDYPMFVVIELEQGDVVDSNKIVQAIKGSKGIKSDEIIEELTQEDLFAAMKRRGEFVGSFWNKGKNKHNWVVLDADEALIVDQINELLGECPQETVVYFSQETINILYKQGFIASENMINGDFINRNRDRWSFRVKPVCDGANVVFFEYQSPKNYRKTITEKLWLSW